MCCAWIYVGYRLVENGTAVAASELSCTEPAPMLLAAVERVFFFLLFSSLFAFGRKPRDCARGGGRGWQRVYSYYHKQMFGQPWCQSLRA